MTPLENASVQDGAISIQETEFAVQSSIAVREEYKSKLQALLQAVALESSRGIGTQAIATRQPGASANKKWNANSSSKKTPARTTSEDPPRVPQGKEMQVLGDWLLLVRAASVNVVEKIQTWRRVVHQGRPQPFYYNPHPHHEQSGNYLLTMCEDLDFLDQSVDLVEWLGFRLARNPFGVHGALDDVVSETLSKAVHSARSLKYWSSSSWGRQKEHLGKMKRKTKIGAEPESDYQCDQTSASSGKTKDSTTKITRPQPWRAHRRPPPPQALVKPLASILPEDDVVDGARIGAAQRVLLEEEAFHGRLRALRAIRQYLVDVSSASSDDTKGSSDESELKNHYASVYDEIADLTTQLNRLEMRFSLSERERNQVLLTIEDLDNQMAWTQKTRERDLTKDHRVWRCRDAFYKELARVFTVLSDELSKRLRVLTNDNIRTKELMEKRHDHLKQLLREKDKQRVEKNDLKRREDELRRAEIRQKTVARTAKIRATKKPISKIQDTNSEILVGNSRTCEEVQELVKLVEQQHALPNGNRGDELEQKRLAAIYQRELVREANARTIADAAKELDRRRDESVRMRREDELSSALERLASEKQRLRDLKIRLERISSMPVFTCAQQLSGKKLRVTIYEQRARGYILGGLRIVAYDPSSSTSFPLVMARREYHSLGYGRTAEGFSAFCKWLCLLYEKRKRHFRLIWSGPPCPPPLRVREYDSVICIHKEGLKLSGTANRRSSGYFLVAAFVRPNTPAKLHFVVSDLRNGGNPICLEKVVHASSLVHPRALQVQCGRYNDDSFVVWKHHNGASGSSDSGYLSQDVGQVSPNGRRHSETRVYSGEARVLDRSVIVHVYDASPTEYALEFQTQASSPMMKKKSSSKVLLVPPGSNDFPTKRIALFKHEVNPYDVRLPSSAFSDLVASIDFAPVVGSDGVELAPVVTPKWLDKLTKYVRVLKMARFGLRVDRKYFLATLSIVQQKTEFRSYLLLELSSLSDHHKKQSIRISLSDYLRCVNASRHILPIEHAEGDECVVCDRQTVSSSQQAVDNEETTVDGRNGCPSCCAIQDARLLSVRQLVTLGHGSLEEAQIDYHGHCQLCRTLAEPILVVLNCFTTAAAAGLIQLLGYHFSCFDMATQDTGERAIVVDDLRQAIEVERIVVLFNADCGATTTAASEFTLELHSQLYPEPHEFHQPFHAVFVVDNHGTAGHQWPQVGPTVGPRDQDVLEALEALTSAAYHIGDQEPIRENAEDESGILIKDALSFEAYLVSEALLVEAMRVVLQPETPWRKPGETVGASSWGAACEFLSDPHALSMKLRLVRPSSLPQSSQETLDAYFAHVKWPQSYADVRPIFHGLLCLMLHFSHICHVLQSRGGILQSSSSSSRGIDGQEGDRNRISVISLE